MAKIEDGFSDLLKDMRPSTQLFGLVKAMMKDAWSQRAGQAKATKAVLQKQLTGIDKKIEEFLDRIVESSSQSVISAYEKRIENLERDKIGLAEKIANMTSKRGQLEEFIELALEFLSSPWKIYESGSYQLKHIVIGLSFLNPIPMTGKEVIELPIYRSLSRC